MDQEPTSVRKTIEFIRQEIKKGKPNFDKIEMRER